MEQEPLETGTSQSGASPILPDGTFHLEARKNRSGQGTVSDMHLNQVLERANYGVMISSLDCTILYVNSCFAGQRDRTREECIGQHMSHFHSPELMKRIQKLAVRAAGGRSTAAIKVWHVRKNGEKCPMLMDIFPLFGPSSAPEFFAATSVDITEKKAIEALRESEARYHSLVECFPDHVFILDHEGTFLASNDRLPNPGFTSGSELVGHKVAEVYPPDVAFQYALILGGIRESGRQAGFVHALAGQEGATYHQVTLNPIQRDDRSWVVGGTSRDITEQNTELLSLRESERKFRLLYEDAPIAYQCIDARGILMEVNAAWLRLLGYEREEVVGRPLRDFLDEKAWGTRIEPDASIEMALVRKDGSRIAAQFDCRSGPSLDGKTTMLYGILRDVTGQKASSVLLRRSEQSHREVECLGGIGSWEYDVCDKRVWWSDMMYQLFDRNPADGPLQFEENARMYGENEALFREFARRAFTKGERAETVLEIMLPNGRRCWHHSIINAELDSRGDITRMFGTVHDVTDQKRLEKQLRESQTLLVQRNQDLERKNLALQELIQHLRESGKVSNMGIRHARVPGIMPLPRELSGLTPRELQVIMHIRKGLSSKEMASQMGISFRSVESHRNHIRKKLDLKGTNLSSYVRMLLGQPSD